MELLNLIKSLNGLNSQILRYSKKIYAIPKTEHTNNMLILYNHYNKLILYIGNVDF